MSDNKCILSKNVKCRNIQICTSNKIICCDELDEILEETILEIISIIDDILDKPKQHLKNHLIDRGIRVLSYAANICPIENSEQKEMMFILTSLVNDYRKVEFNKNEVIFQDFLILLSYLRNWFRVHYLDYAYSEVNLIDQILSLVYKIGNILNPKEDEDYIF